MIERGNRASKIRNWAASTVGVQTPVRAQERVVPAAAPRSTDGQLVLPVVSEAEATIREVMSTCSGSGPGT